jgi:NADPH2:quinone reductase
MMTAIEVAIPGGPEALKPTQRPIPVLKAGEVLIEVSAAGINRPDVLQRKGHYDPPPGASDIPGLEVAGRIVGVADDVTGLKTGDRVCALVAGGGYAEYCAAPAVQCLPIPEGFTAVQAAALPETFFTVWSNVFDRGRLVSGETFLVHGGSSGIGTTAIQLAKAFGAKVFATAGSKAKCEACAALGADRAINYREEDFAAIIKAEGGGRGIDVVLDMVGGDYVERSLSVMAPDGRHVSIAFLKGAKVNLNLQTVMLKRLTLTGSTLRARPIADKAAIAEKLLREVWPKLATGAIKPLIHGVFPLAEAPAAHALMESSEHIGKIVLVVRDEAA